MAVQASHQDGTHVRTEACAGRTAPARGETQFLWPLNPIRTEGNLRTFQKQDPELLVLLKLAGVEFLFLSDIESAE